MCLFYCMIPDVTYSGASRRSDLQRPPGGAVIKGTPLMSGPPAVPATPSVKHGRHCDEVSCPCSL